MVDLSIIKNVYQRVAQVFFGHQDLEMLISPLILDAWKLRRLFKKPHAAPQKKTDNWFTMIWLVVSTLLRLG